MRDGRPRLDPLFYGGAAVGKVWVVNLTAGEADVDVMFGQRGSFTRARMARFSGWRVCERGGPRVPLTAEEVRAALEARAGLVFGSAPTEGVRDGQDAGVLDGAGPAPGAAPLAGSA